MEEIKKTDDFADENFILDLDNRAVFSAIVEPHRIVNVPRYLLQWIKFLKPGQVILWIVFFQLAFLKTRVREGVTTIQVRVDEILNWLPVSRASFFRLINEERTKVFLERIDSKSRCVANRYRFCFDPCLTPEDQFHLKRLLLEFDVYHNPCRALQNIYFNLQKEGVQWRKHAVISTSAYWSEYTYEQKNLLDIITNLVPSLHQTPEILELCDANFRIVTMMDNAPLRLTWYFIKQWLPELGAGPGLLVLYLRSKCFFSDDETRNILYFDDVQALADVLGLSRLNTLYDWLPSVSSSGRKPVVDPSDSTKAQRNRNKKIQRVLSKFIEVTKENQRLCIMVRNHFEPLTEADETLYDLLFEIVAEINRSGCGEIFLEWIEHCTRENKLIHRIETIKFSPFTDLRHNEEINHRFDTLNRVLIHIIDIQKTYLFTDLRLLRILKRINSLIKVPLTTTHEKSGDDGWDLDTILERVGVFEDERRDAISNCESSTILSWVFYIVSRQAKSIESKPGFITSKLKPYPGKSAESVFINLTRIPREEMLRLIAHGEYVFDAPRDWEHYMTLIDSKGLKELRYYLSHDERADEPLAK